MLQRFLTNPAVQQHWMDTSPHGSFQRQPKITRTGACAATRPESAPRRRGSPEPARRGWWRDHRRRARQRAVLACLAVVVLMLGGCVATSKQRPDEAASSYEANLRAADELMSERRFGEALDRLRDAARRRPDDAAPHFLQAQCVYRMERHDEAVAAFDAALARDPSHFQARHRRWAALRAMAPSEPQTVQRIEAEIHTLLAEQGEKIAALILEPVVGQRDAQRRLVRRLAAVVGAEPLADEVAGFLSEEIILAADPGERLRLAEAYLDAFPSGSRAADVSELLVVTASRQQPEPAAFNRTINRLLERYPANRHVRLHLAGACLARGTCVERAEQLLADHAALLNAMGSPSEGAETDSMVPDAAARERSAAHYLSARLSRFRGDAPAASLALAKVSPSTEYFPAAQRLLAELAVEAGDATRAVVLLRAALEAGDRDRGTSARLRQLLAAQYGYEGYPARFFAAREGVTSFSDVTVQAGLEGLAGKHVAWGDYDGDGFDDLLLDGGRVLRNDAARAFVDVSETLGLSPYERFSGGVWGDYDDDGLLDLFVHRRDEGRLLRNAGSGFVDVSEAAFGGALDGPIAAAAWGELDNDGRLDLYVGRYERGGPERALCAPDVLLRGRRDGRFDDVSRRAGILTDEPLCARGVAWADLNDDGRQDIVVANYRLDPNLLWLNAGADRLVDQAREAGVRGANKWGAYGNSLAAVPADFDDDGDLDLFVSNLAHPRAIAYSDLSMLLRNGGGTPLGFVDRFRESGMRFEETSADAAAADVDNDGDIDLYVTSVYPNRPSHLYLNKGDGTFDERTWLTGTRVADGWGAAFSDYDNDGDMDLLVASPAGVRLLRNETTDRHWLAVSVRSRRCNRFGVGAVVTLSHGDRRLTRHIAAGKGSGTQDSMRAHFGLGDYAGPVRLSLRDACGETTRHHLPATDRTVELGR